MILVKISDRSIKPLDGDVYNRILDALNGKTCELDLVDHDRKSGKKKMFAYYRGVLLPIFHKELRDRGYNIDIDGAHTFYCMAKYGKDVKLNPLTDTPESVPGSMSDWSKARTQEYIDDLVIDLLEEFGLDAPDSAEYLADLEKKKKRKNLLILNAKNRWEK